MTCIHCNDNHPEYYSYCPQTGRRMDEATKQQLQTTVNEFCVQCGQQNEAQYCNCTNCGNQLTKTELQRINIGNIINQTTQNIPLSGEKLKENLKENLKTERIKSFSLGHFKQVKKAPLMIIPVLVSILLVIMLSIGIKSATQDELVHAIGADFEELQLLGNKDFLRMALEQEGDISTIKTLKVPSFPYVASTIMLLHNVDYEMKFQMNVFEDINVGIKTKNLTAGLSFIVFVILAIGAVTYGILAKKNQWAFWRGVFYSAIIYTVFVTLTALLARYNLRVIGIDAWDDPAQIIGHLTPSIFSAIMSSFILSLLAFSLFGYIAYHGKRTWAQIQTEVNYMQYAFYSLTATIVGLIIHQLHALAALKKLFDGQLSSGFSGLMSGLPLGDSALKTMLGFTQPLYTWQLSLLGTMNATTIDDYGTPVLHYRLLFNDSLSNFSMAGIYNKMVGSLFILPPVVLVLITLLLIASIGYFSYSKHQLQLKEVALFTGIFTALQLLLSMITKLKLETFEYDYPRREGILIDFSFFPTLLKVFIFTFAVFYLGGFIRKRFGR